MGKPILSYPIAAAKKSGLFDSIIVSTEDREIREAAIGAGATVLRRPNNLARDRATVVQVCLHVLQSLKKANALHEDFCCIYPTAIFLLPEDLRRSFSLMDEEPKADFVMGVSEFNLQPVQALIEKEGFLRTMWPEFRGVQSQFQPRLVASNGTFYWARTEVFLRAKTFYGKRLKGFLIPRIRAVDLDTPEDLQIVEIIAPHVLKAPNGS